MLLYQLRLGWKSLLRTPVLTLLTLLAVAVGVAVATSSVALDGLLRANPIEEQSQSLYYVRLDSWNPDRPFDDDRPELPPTQVTYQDAMALLESDVPTRQIATYKSGAFVFPENPDLQPFGSRLRLTGRDFFDMFEVPFRLGGPWSAEADAAGERVVVLDHETNQKLFGDADSIGRDVRIDKTTFTVVGVLAPWRPLVTLYDPHNGGFDGPENVYLPLRTGLDLQMWTNGNTSNWSGDSSEWDSRLVSEAIWIQFWAQLDSPQQIDEYQAWLDGYAEEQRAVGRFQRPNNNLIQPFDDFHVEMRTVPDMTRSIRMIALLFLLVCAVNLIGLLLGKFLARSSEVGVRRALGASRSAIFMQYLVECLLVALGGGLIGLLASRFILRWMASGMGPEDFHLPIDLSIALAAIGLALVAGGIAGAYPAWRVCTVPPAFQLKKR